MAEDLFDNIQTAIDETEQPSNAPHLRDDPNFLCAKPTSTETLDAVHLGFTDSSDDEDNRDWQSAKYNECGRAIKRLINTPCSSSSLSSDSSSSWKAAPRKHNLDDKQLQLPSLVKNVASEIYTDPIFGMRIINPLITSIALKQRMEGRVAVPLIKLRNFIASIPPQVDWVVGGVIVSKTERKSQRGNQFSIWTLSDLHGDLKTVSLFLFQNAFKEMWKTSVGTAIGVLNPSILEKRQGSTDEAVLSVDNIHKILIIGTSKDYGTCKSIRKDGTPCTSFVNVNKCEVCTYHVRQEYQKSSKRQELQSAYSGRGLTALRNKVLGKNEVFYAGKSFTALPATKSRKLQAKDAGRLDSLRSDAIVCRNTTKNSTESVKRAGIVQHVEVSAARRKKDLELLKKLGGINTKKLEEEETEQRKDEAAFLDTSAAVTLKESKSTALNVISMLKAKKLEKSNSPEIPEEDSSLQTSNSSEQKPNSSNEKENAKIVKKSRNNNINIPLLSSGNKLIDLSKPITKTAMTRANLNALKFVEKHGPIKKQDPNSVKTAKGQRKRMQEPAMQEQNAKRQKIAENEHFSQRFKQMMAATSAHQDLLAKKDNDEFEQYFDKLEAKERLEEKMISTYKVECKAVQCALCKYTAFSAADRCKQEKHPLKVFDAMKRFFKCGDCGNRTVTLLVFPTKPCKKCNSGKWERAGMMRERIVGATSVLSIRGGEQTFVNSHVTNTNIDLLVPED